MTNDIQRIWSLYRVTNIVNGKIYIGQTVQNPDRRWSKHISNTRSTVILRPITWAIKKHGEDNFTFEIIAQCRSLDDANYLETELVKQYESHISTSNGYNVAWGGSNEPLSEERKKKISATLKGKKKPPRSKEHCRNISESHKGKRPHEWLEVSRKKMTKAMIGNKNAVGNNHLAGKTWKLVDGKRVWMDR